MPLEETILIVDDEPGILDAYRQYLDPPPPAAVYRSSRTKTPTHSETPPPVGPRYRVLLAQSGERAVELVQEELRAGRRVAAGFFDVMMPGGMDGLETIRAVHALDPDVLCAVVTAYNDRTVDDIARFFPAQSQDEWDYLSKPFTEGEIRQKARNLVAAWQRRRRDVEQRSNLERLIAHLSRLKGLSFPDLLRCFDYVLQEVVAFTGARGGFLATVNQGIAFQVGIGTLATADSAGKVLEKLRTSGALDEFLRDPRVQTTTELFIVPILCVRADEVAVFLSCDSPMDDRRELVRIFAENAGAAVDNFLLYEELQELTSSLEGRIQARTHELTDSNQRLSETSAELAEMLERLKQAQQQLVHSEKLAVMGQMAATVAHEINNPGFFIQVNLEEISNTAGQVVELLALLNGGADAATVRAWRAQRSFDAAAEELKALVTESQSGLTRILTIVRDLRSFGRIDRDEAVRVSVTELLDRALRILGNEIKHRALVHFDRRELADALADEGRLLQVMINLMTNALHAMESRPIGESRLELAVWPESDIACFAVRDNGTGIAPEILDKIFDPFFTTKPVGQGTGLGLGICRSIVEQLGGTIRVDTELGVGTKITVALPRAT